MMRFLPLLTSCAFITASMIEAAEPAPLTAPAAAERVDTP